MTDDPDPSDWVDPDDDSPPVDPDDDSSPRERDPNPIWDALRDLVDDLQEWAGQTARLVRRLRQVLSMMTLRSLLIVSGGAGAYEFASGMSIKDLSVINPTRAALGVLLLAPLAKPMMSVLARESQRHHKRTSRITAESVPNYDAQISVQAHRHKILGRRLATNTNLPNLPGMHQILEDLVARLEHYHYSSSVILTRRAHSIVEVVLASGDIEPRLSVGTVWTTALVTHGKVPYESIVRQLELHHAQVQFTTGEQVWDLICVTGGTLSDHPTLLLAQSVTRLLEAALDLQQERHKYFDASEGANQ